MAVIKQQTIEGQTFKLLRFKDTENRGRGQFRYEIEAPDGDRIPAGFNKQAAMNDFRNLIKRRRPMIEKRSSDSGGLGLF